jgi:hypothetical protein
MIREIEARLRPPALTVPTCTCELLKIEDGGTYGDAFCTA